MGESVPREVKECVLLQISLSLSLSFWSRALVYTKLVCVGRAPVDSAHIKSADLLSGCIIFGF